MKDVNKATHTVVYDFLVRGDAPFSEDPIVILSDLENLTAGPNKSVTLGLAKYHLSKLQA